jgi:NADH-quinone oxidoreductase subunit K
MSAGLNIILAASAALFAVGGFALVARRSAIVTLMGTQLLLMAGGIAFVAFGRFGLGAQSRNAAAIMAIFAGAIGIAEMAIGVAMAAVLYHEQPGFLIDGESR